jgi:hypothetical protein
MKIYHLATLFRTSTRNVVRPLQTERLLYDSGTILSALGGNLGLALGVSGLSLLLGLISALSNCRERMFSRLEKWPASH